MISLNTTNDFLYEKKPTDKKTIPWNDPITYWRPQ
jgi:hypothetical protein